MAQLLLFSVMIHNPPSSSDFSAFDVIDTYWDDSTSAIVVKKNNSVFAGSPGAHFGELDTNYYLSGATSFEGEYAVAGYSFCSGDDLKWFRMLLFYPFYPYAQLRTTADSPVCATGGGAVCDIAWVGAPVITHATNLTDGGTVTVEATSSNGTVKYGLNGLQSYAAMSNTTGVLTGMIPGTWTIFAKDANDCTTQKQVTVLYKPAVAEHYRFTWDAVPIGGNTMTQRVRIYEREYPGSLVEINAGAPSPFHIHKPKAGELNNKLTPVHPTGAMLSLASEEDYQFLPLFTQDNKRYRAVYEVDDGGGFEEVWQGFFEPNIYREDFVAAPYYTEFQISDNVRHLEKIDFADDNGNPMYGNLKLIKVIAHVMKKTGLELSIRSGINIFETNHDTDPEDDPLDQTYIDVSCYRDGTDPFSCWQVLESILKPFGARIVQSDNQWLIEEIDRAHEGYDYRIFDVDGDYESNGTADVVMNIKAPSETDRVALINSDHSMEIVPAYGKISLSRKFNYIGSIVAGGFEKEDLLAPESEIEIKAQGVFKSEEGFNGWTLRQPSGVSGVSFGRVIVGRRGDTERLAISGEEDLTRSVGAFYYSADSWTGNLRNAYIESASKPYQYGPNDELKIRFEHSTSSKTEYPFMVLRFMVKIGSDYLQHDSDWDTTEHIFRAYPSINNSLQTFELLVPTPETDEIVDTTIQFRIYFYASEFYDYGLPPAADDNQDPSSGTSGLSDLRGLVTATINYDYRLDSRYHKTTGSVTNYGRIFYELRDSAAADDPDNGIVRPNDFNATTNPWIWWEIGSTLENNPVGNRRGVDRKFYVDDITIDALPNGQPPPTEDTISLEVSKHVTETLEVDLYNFDVPDVTNAKNMYNNYFKLSDGTPTETWSRSGISESLPLTHILLKVIGGNHSAPTFRLTGSFINEFERIGTKNYLKLTKAGSNLSLSNTEFTSDLSGWSQAGTGEAFTWNSGAAQVVLSGAEDSQKIYQSVTNSGGYIAITGELTIASTGDREDIFYAVFYRGADIIHAEKLNTFSGSTSGTYAINHIAFAPGDIDRVGFFFKHVTGTGDRTYAVTEFSPDGSDIEEMYQITDYQSDEKNRTAILELMQQSKTYISLAGIDTGGTNQGGSTSGRAHSSGHSSGYN